MSRKARLPWMDPIAPALGSYNQQGPPPTRKSPHPCHPGNCGFLGLDVRIRDSGTKRGQRKLTKQGDPELRRLLYLAAMQAKSKPAWQGYYQLCQARGLAPVQALNVLARKLARVGFALMKHQTYYQPIIPCTQT